jgi:hypothetical protein
MRCGASPWSACTATHPLAPTPSRRIAQGKSKREVLRCLIGGLSRSRLEGRAVASR